MWCACVCVCVCVCVCPRAQLCLTLCNPMDCRQPGSSVHGIFLVRILEWVTMPSSRGSSRPKNWTCVSCTAGGFSHHWATRKALKGGWLAGKSEETWHALPLEIGSTCGPREWARPPKKTLSPAHLEGWAPQNQERINSSITGDSAYSKSTLCRHLAFLNLPTERQCLHWWAQNIL